LLPSGVVTVEGRFERGDVVAVVAPEGKEVVRGIVNFSDWEVARIAGRHTHEIELLLGRRGYDEVISRNNLVLV
jgi:glutamate 5-kinase